MGRRDTSLTGLVKEIPAPPPIEISDVQSCSARRTWLVAGPEIWAPGLERVTQQLECKASTSGPRPISIPSAVGAMPMVLFHK